MWYILAVCGGILIGVVFVAAVVLFGYIKLLNSSL